MQVIAPGSAQTSLQGMDIKIGGGVRGDGFMSAGLPRETTKSASNVSKTSKAMQASKELTSSVHWLDHHDAEWQDTFKKLCTFKELHRGRTNVKKGEDTTGSKTNDVFGDVTR